MKEPALRSASPATSSLDALPLSRRAIAWLGARRVTRIAAPRSPEETTARLAAQGAPAWPVLLAVEATFGGLRGDTPDDRELWIGTCGGRWFGSPRKGAPMYAVAAFSPIVWYMDEGGRVIEYDELGVNVYQSDSLAHRIEELAIHRTIGEPFAGQHGERFAAALGLTEVAEVRDSMSRAWGEARHDHVRGTLVAEMFAPFEYGQTDRTWTTWVNGPPATLQKLKRLVSGA